MGCVSMKSLARRTTLNTTNVQRSDVYPHAVAPMAANPMMLTIATADSVNDRPNARMRRAVRNAWPNPARICVTSSMFASMAVCASRVLNAFPMMSVCAEYSTVEPRV